MKVRIFLSILIAVYLSLCCKMSLATGDMQPINTYASKETLIAEPNIYQLYWNYTDTDVVFELMTRKSNGWIFFGFTSNSSIQDGITPQTKKKT
jgi:hypothetical protein